MPALVRLENVSFTYERSITPALREINLELREGEFVVLLGPIGSGKSTLLRIISGLIPSYYPGVLEGQVSICGLDPRKIGPSELIECVGLVLNDPGKQILGLTVWDDISFGPTNIGLPDEEVERRTRYSIRALRLTGLEYRHPRELSGGQQQRVGIAGVLALRPRVIALDEPLSMLDPIGKREVLEVLRDLNEDHGVACIVSESGVYLDEFLDLADKVVVLDSGRVVFSGKPEDLVKYERLEELGVGTPQIPSFYRELSKRHGVNHRIPLNIEEAVENLSKLISNHVITMEEVCRELGQKIHRSTVDTAGQTVLIVENLWYEYPSGTRAVQGVSLEVREGEVVGIIGPNGSGKTTLALILAGVLRPTNKDARVLIEGVEIWRLSRQERIRKINYVFQDPDNQLLSVKVFDELAFALRVLGLDKEEIERLVKEISTDLGISDYLNVRSTTLGRDQRVLVAIASVFVLKPKILIVDEPTGGLDRRSSERIMNLLMPLTRKGHTIVIISHDMKLVYEHCNRVLVMSDGRILLDDVPEEVFSRLDLLSKIYIKPPPLVELGHRLCGNINVWRR